MGRDSRRGWDVTAVALAALFALALTPAARVVELVAAPGAFVLVLALWRIGRPLAAVEFTLWLYLVSPGLRRIVDYHSTYHSTSLILLTAPAASVAVVLPCLFVQRSMTRDLAHLLAIGVALLSMALLIGVLDNGAAAAAAGAANWIPPVCLGVAVLALPVLRSDLHAMIWRVATAGTLVLGVYGIVQWLILPAWDAAWMRDVGNLVNSIGPPIAQRLRVFSLSNSPGPASAALLAGVLIIAAKRRQDVWTVAALVSGVAAIGLTAVRQAWLAAGLAVVLLVARRIARVSTISAAVVLVSALALAVPSATAVVTTRFNNSVNAGTGDESLNARASFQAAALPTELVDWTGHGLGSTGAGVRAASSSASDAFANTDSGYLEMLRTLGSVGTVLFLVTFFAAVAGAWRRSRGLRLETALAALLVTLPFQLLLGNVFIGPGAAFLWLGLGLIGRVGPALGDPTHLGGGEAARREAMRLTWPRRRARAV